MSTDRLSPIPHVSVKAGRLASLQAQRLSDFKVAVFDMDSTLIPIECIDELAVVAGKGEEVAAITEAAMRGELANFSESLTRRLAILRGLPESALAQVMAERLTLNPGAEALLAALHQAGVHTVLVSGGFTYFAKEVQRRLGIHHAVANELAFEDGCLTGQVTGPIVDGERKRTELLAACERLGVPASAAIAVGDGANDLPMMQAAGLSVAYMAKPKVQAQADVAVEAPGLDRWLALLGS
ncbi:MAG: phosphoserine phosphatase SerB [Burkholderiaceae bacterium]|nr:MAG: phosphoserine phosphatase SerB [Burkholderiaceae bacterium]